jgi:HSP20 family protein
MSLIQWDPFAVVNTLIRFMPTGSTTGRPRLAGEGNGARKIEWSQSADISETDKAYVVRVELPAVRKEDVKVTIDQGGTHDLRRTQTADRRQEREIPSRRELLRNFRA